LSHAKLQRDVEGRANRQFNLACSLREAWCLRIDAVLADRKKRQPKTASVCVV
jgi:hypothetical protein